MKAAPEHVADCLARGLSVRETAALLGVSSATVYRKARAAGVDLPGQATGAHQATDGKCEAVRLALAKHGTIRGAARELGWSPSRVRYLLRRYGGAS